MNFIFMFVSKVDLVDQSNSDVPDDNKWMGHYIDHFTKYHFLWSQKTKSAEETAQCLVNNVFSVVGLPRILQHDNGPEFCNKVSTVCHDFVNCKALGSKNAYFNLLNLIFISRGWSYATMTVIHPI